MKASGGTLSAAWIERAVGFTVAVNGGLALIGYQAGFPQLYSLFPHLPPIKYAAAVCLVFAGAALWSRWWANSWPAIVAAALTAIWGGVTLLAYVTGSTSGPSFLDYITLAPRSSLMSANAAICALLAGAGLLAVTLRRRGNAAIAAVSMLGAISAGVGSVAFFGYLSGISPAMLWRGESEYAPQAAFSFTAIGLLLIAAAWRIEGPRTIARARWMAAANGVGFLVALLGFWRAFENEWEAQGLRSSQLSTGLLIGAVTVAILAAMLFFFALAAHLRGEDLRLAHAALERRAEKLATSNAELRRFAVLAAHDLKEPLRDVIIACQSFRGATAAGLSKHELAPLDEAIATAKLGVQRLDLLVEYSSLTDVTLKATDLNVVANQVIGRLDATIRGADASITADALPTIRADAGRIAQVLEALITNALTYRRAEAPRIVIAARPLEDGSWLFSVEDNGRGIPAAYHDKAFTLFGRINDPGSQSGLGAGLAKCKRAIEAHGGKIWLESELGRSTTVYFTLPTEDFEAASAASAGSLR